MKNLLNRELIEDLNESNNPEFVEQTNDKVASLVGQVVEDISKKSPFIKLDKCVFQTVNEAFSGAFAQLSEFSYFLGIDNPQIEINTKNRKNMLKFLWREFKANFRLGKKKYKKKKNEVETIQPMSKYKLSDFCHDFVLNLANYLDETSLIYEYSDHISIIGQEDFGTGVRINIYFCCFDNRNAVYKLFLQRKNKFFTFSFGKRFENIILKTKECSTLYIDMIKIFNAIYSKNYNKIPNQILVESLVFNCPNSLFVKDDVYNTFINIANFICVSDPQALMSICDTSKNIFEESLIVKGNQQVGYSKIVNMLNNFKY